ncbi:alpha/beta fold hydrolase [Dokdonella sp.]|uniref:alpha/beta hydrolase family protein n=1 Tax=Dokdonella sp. TaxID=2291710 RepID=UPI001B10DA56|nr:alpha/beta fold hydrolase [Dokdonella sp.]MBO9662738.1 alpha/beta fold hydrolase [Dokdonella sp.]
MAASLDATIDERAVRVVSGDCAAADVYVVQPRASVREAVVWLPALGVAARNYLPFAHALAARGVAVALHEWRGIGSSDRRAGRASNWGYRELLAFDLPATLAAAREAFPGARLWLGGHSLGGQLAALYAGLHADEHAGLLLVASGAPYWRTFPWYRGIGVFFAVAPWIAAVRGHFPGRRLGFGGNEARGVIADWTRSGRTGRYAAAGLDEDLERRLSTLRLPILALRLQDDWLAPLPSLDWLLGKMPQSSAETALLGPADLGGVAADHFAWMKAPDAVAERLATFVRQGRSG